MRIKRRRRSRIMIRDAVGELGEELIRVGVEAPQDLLYELKSLVENSRRGGAVDVEDWSYPIPDEYIEEAVDAYETFSTQDFLENWLGRISGDDYVPAEDYFDTHYGTLEVYKTLELWTHDGGYLIWSYGSPEYIYNEDLLIITASEQATKVYKILTGSEVWRAGADIFGIQFGPKEPTLEEI